MQLIKKRSKKAILIFFSVILLSSPVFPQVNNANLAQLVQNNKNPGKEGIKKFYAQLNYQPAWIQNQSERLVLFNAVKDAASLGLEKNEYSFDYLASFNNGSIHLKNTEDSLEAEITITTIALHLYSDLVYGNIKPPFGYNGINYDWAYRDIPVLLAEYIQAKKLNLLISELSKGIPELTALENKIKWFTTIIAEDNFREVIIVPRKINDTNKNLVLKLYQLGITTSITDSLPGSILKEKIKEAQRQFALLADGTLRSTLIQELNVPLAIRFRELKLSINYFRWLNCLVQYQPAVVVNIPAAYMKVYRNGKIITEMKMVVGKPSTPTPTLTSTITEVILYPYWHVPFSIATKELLPIIKRSPAYINTGGYQVLDSKTGRIVDPYAVNWHSLSRNYFPYTIRQSTGCDNALGLLKLNFYSPYGVYLHDTPMKFAFSMNRRYLSHGCMRMEKPMQLGHLVLDKNRIAIDTLEQKGCLRNQAPITVKVEEKIGVVVWYNPAGVDAEGRVVFYEDVYGKFHW